MTEFKVGRSFQSFEDGTKSTFIAIAHGDLAEGVKIHRLKCDNKRELSQMIGEYILGEIGDEKGG